MPRTGSRDCAAKKAQCKAWAGKPSGRGAAARLKKSRLKSGGGLCYSRKGSEERKITSMVPAGVWIRRPGKQTQKERQERADVMEK